MKKLSIGFQLVAWAGLVALATWLCLMFVKMAIEALFGNAPAEIWAVLMAIAYFYALGSTSENICEIARQGDDLHSPERSSRHL
ncbi:hypothetical protein [Erythrobacter sp.]|uniref:hypothetical protein n=1 Tax=Erythrobacter sp. TaxID=1042 RepID=UPI001425EA5A|nr:hypothetical protein [Erythrobacter sp.]QIQ87966.1 MAG: hypothetical protein G9473_15635 [Erythrobacter sp.]